MFEKIPTNKPATKYLRNWRKHEWEISIQTKLWRGAWRHMNTCVHVRPSPIACVYKRCLTPDAYACSRAPLWVLLAVWSDRITFDFFVTWREMHPMVRLRNSDGWRDVLGRLFRARSVMGRLWDEHFRDLGHPPKFYRVQDTGFMSGSSIWWQIIVILHKNHWKIPKHMFVRQSDLNKKKKNQNGKEAGHKSPEWGYTKTQIFNQKLIKI